MTLTVATQICEKHDAQDIENMVRLHGGSTLGNFPQYDSQTCMDICLFSNVVCRFASSRTRRIKTFDLFQEGLWFLHRHRSSSFAGHSPSGLPSEVAAMMGLGGWSV